MKRSDGRDNFSEDTFGDKTDDRTVGIANDSALPDAVCDLSTAPYVRASAASDFGGLIQRTPRAVARPEQSEDVAALLRWAADHRVPIAARGRGHSVYGRSQTADGIVVDMAVMADIGPVLPPDRIQSARIQSPRIQSARITVGAGATWRSVIGRTLREGLVPPVLTNFLDLSVGGTLSIGGVGGTTHAFGMQTDNILELEVVTGEGKVVTCSPAANTELYDVVRAGQGQFGIITRATLALAPAPEHVRRYLLSYPDVASLAADQLRVLRESRADHVQGAVIPAEGGWRYEMELVVFGSGDDAPGDEVLAELRDDRARAQIQDFTFSEYVTLFDRFVDLMRATGEWERPHPWLLTFLPGTAAVPTVRDIIDGLSPEDLGESGRLVFYPLTTRPITTPLARMPDEPVVFTCNLIRSTPSRRGPIDGILQQNKALYRRVRDAGGVLYPVSAVDFDRAEWADHFGDRWETVRRAKARFDPAHCLTPGYDWFEARSSR